MTAALDALGWVVVGAYVVAALTLAALGLHAGLLAAVRSVRPRAALPTAALPGPGRSWPAVVVQIPVYDEPATLVARALDAALALCYPGRVAVQLLDDSPAPARRANAALCALRPGVRHVVRASREGFKAGALAHGLTLTGAPFAAVFDVDFRPPPCTLHRLVGPLLADSGLAFVQARWSHPGAEASAMSRAQAAVLDLHFAVEQATRDRAGWPLAFNGTAGAWRVSAIADAGGWDGATLAEDADLALRAQARGWRARLADAAVPADLPRTVGAWRRQQARWAKGLVEVARLRGGLLWRSPLPLASKLAFSGHLALGLSLPSLLLVVVLHPLAAMLGALGVGPLVPPALAAGYAGLAGVVGAHVVALRALYPATWRRRLGRVPAALAAPLVLVLPASRAVVEALVGHRTPFARTPKDGHGRAEAARSEVALALYSVVGLAVLVGLGAWGEAAFQGILAVATGGAAWVARRVPEVAPAVPVQTEVRAAA